MKWVALALAAILAFSLPLSMAAPYPRQVDPSAAPEEIQYGPGLAQFYGLGLASLSGGNFTGAMSLLLESGLIHVPSSVSYIFQRFNSLIESAGSLLQSAGADIGNATSLADTGRLAEATRFMDSARGELLQANQTVQQLQSAALQAAQNTGMPLSLISPRISALSSLVAKYYVQLAHLEAFVSASKTLVHTNVTLTVSPASVPVGSKALFSGSLSSLDGRPLTGRNVSLYLAGTFFATAVTDSAGNFSALLAVPFIYENKVTAFASFLPTGPDSSVFSPSSSDTVQLDLLFTAPTLTVSAPPVVYPGIQFTVRGRSSAPSGDVLLSAFGASYSTLHDSSGYFSFLVTPPAGQPAGPSTLEVSTRADGAIAPSSATATVMVTRLQPSASLIVPSFAVVGVPFSVSGRVSLNGTSLPGASVLGITPGTGINTTTDSLGLFSTYARAPLTVPTGYWTFSVGVYPGRSWAGAGEAKATVFVVNPATLVFPGFGALFVLSVFFRGRRRGAAASAAVEERAPEAQQQAAARAELGRPNLVEVYSEALGIAELSTGVAQSKSQTLREYLSLVSGSLKGFESFKYITLALESQLYGGGVRPEVEERARAELERLRELNR